MTFRTRRRLVSSRRARTRGFAVGLAMSVALCAACSTSGSQNAPATGMVSAALTLPDGASIDALEYEITGNGVTPITGTINVANSTTANFQLGGIAAGTGYTLSISATTSDAQSCAGSGPFDIVANQTTSVVVQVQCGVGLNSGGVSVDGSVATCSIVSGLSANPTEVVVGGTIALAGSTSPRSAVSWSAAAGTFGDPSASSTAYTCTDAGQQTITLAVSGAPASCPASEQTVVVTCTSTATTIQHAHRGAFNSTTVVESLAQPWKVIGNSYQVRSLGDGTVSLAATRNYFTFDLSSVTGTVTAAELRIHHPATSYDSPDASETIELFDVGTSSSTLQAPDETMGTTLLTSIFSDLGTGTSFGSFTADASDNGTTEAVTLNAAAVSSINSAITAGASWSIGGSLTTGTATGFGVRERVFRASDETGGNPPPATELVLTLQ